MDIAYGNTAVELQTLTASHQCQACFKNFTTAGNLQRHMESSKVCQMWIESKPPSAVSFNAWETDRALFKAQHKPLPDATQDPQLPSVNFEIAPEALKTRKIGKPNVLTGSMILDTLTPKGTECSACKKEFSTVGCLTRHYKTSVACDRTRVRDMMAVLQESAEDFKTGFLFKHMGGVGTSPCPPSSSLTGDKSIF